MAKLEHAVNLNKLAERNDTRYQPEIFAAARMTNYKPLSVNVFHSGSVVVCGLRDPEYIFVILKELETIINMY